MKILEPVELNAADFAILVVVGLSCILGLWRGLIREVLVLVSWIAIVLVSWLYIRSLANLMQDFIEQPVLQTLIAFLIIFFGVVLLRLGLTKVLRSMLKLAGLALMDRILGGVFGVLRGVLIVCVVLYLVGIFFDVSVLDRSELWSESVLIPHGAALIEWAESIFAQSRTELVI